MYNSTASPPPSYDAITSYGVHQTRPVASIKYLQAPPTKSFSIPQAGMLVNERERRPYSSVNEVNDTFPLLPQKRRRSRNAQWKIVILLAAAIHIFILMILLPWSLPSALHPSPTGSWVNITASPNCSSVGSRIYTAVSSHMPEGFQPDNQCMKKSIHIHGRLISTPLECYSEPFDREISESGGTRRNVTYTITRGKWLVDWDEPSCVPTWDPLKLYIPGLIPDAQCQTHRERGYTAFLTVSRTPPGLDPLDSCEQTPATIHRQQVFPSHCQMEKRTDGVEVVRARFIVEESSCTPVWVNLTASPVCTSIGARMYSAVSSHMPLGYQPDLHCSTRPIQIHGRVLPQPLSCRSEAVERFIYDGINNSSRKVVQTLTTGKWLVDFEEKSCVPTWDPNVVPDQFCLAYGKRGYTATMTVSRIPRGLDPIDSCRNTPLVVDGDQQVFPSECRFDLETGTGVEVVRARFVADDRDGCATAVWTNVQPDYQCSEYGVKRFTGYLVGIPAGLDLMEVCREVPYMFFGVEERRPELCEKMMDGDGVERVRGSWMIDFRVPECHPVLRELEDKVCSLHFKGCEARKRC
ncbi:hypothetical protein L218DRAFT_575103 [Marasmius fiardii PR-910]|nr:hypothetical protein L218DRAFT_575103 [Marasmius fiardii PR-910]